MRQAKVQPTTDPALQAAFALLHEVVRDFEVTGRLALTTGVKPEMQRRSGRQFQEQALGFATFGEFLQAAVHNGVVVVLDHKNGRQLHVEGVVPAPRRHVPTPSPLLEKPAGRPDQIRSDLWRAFIDWRPGLRRMWDKEEECAVIFTAKPTALSTSDDQAVREAVVAAPDRFIEITPVSQETQLRWMRRFVQDLNDPKLRDSLLLLLQATTRPFAAFASMLRGMPEVQGAWQARRRDLVTEEISRWSRDHGLTVDPLVSPSTKDGPEQASEQAPPSTQPRFGSKSNEVETRQMYRNAIDRMPTEELLRLPIPLVYLLDGPESP